MKQGIPEQQIYFEMMRDLKTLIQLFDLQLNSPHVITNEILSRGKEKLHSVLHKVEVIQAQRNQESRPSLPQGQTPPYYLIEDIASQFDRSLSIEINVSDEIPPTAIPDDVFRHLIRGLFDCAMKTQFGLNQKTIEISASAHKKFMIIKFKDYSTQINPGISKEIIQEQISKLKSHAMNFGGDLSLNESIGRFRDYILKLPFPI